MYEDNYALQDAYNTIDKYNLDSAKFIFRILTSYKHLNKPRLLFHVGKKSKIIYGSENIMKFDKHIFSNWGNIWIRMARANIFTKGLLLLNDVILNYYKNVWDDIWFNTIINKASYSYLVFERIGYIYLQDGLGEGSPRFNSKSKKEKGIKEWLEFLNFNYHFLPKNDTKIKIIEKLKKYNKKESKFHLSDLNSDFYILNNLLTLLINDTYVEKKEKKFLKDLLKESNMREKKTRKK